MDNGGACTGRLLEAAGIAAGMRVLDVGCGHGDVSLRLATIVGPAGRVIGIDRDKGSLEKARERAAAAELANAEFVEGDLNAGTLPHGPFDAVVGRRVLMYLPKPEGVLRTLATVMRPGAVIVFQEHDSALIGAGALPFLHARIHEMLWRTIAHEGGNVHMGFALAPALRSAGFAVAGVRVEATVLTPELSPPIAQLVSVMLPRMAAAGMASADELDLDTLAPRLTDERVASGKTLPWETIFGVWGHAA